MLLIPHTATYSKHRYDYVPGVCRDNLFGEPAQYQTRTVEQFVRGAGQPVRIPTYPARNRDFVGFWQAGMGHSYIVGNAPLPVLKGEGGFRRPKPKSTRTRKEFEALKKAGAIVTSDVSLGSVLVDDAVLPLSPATGVKSNSLEVGSSLLFQAKAPCSNSVVTYAITREGSGIWNNTVSAFTPEVNSSLSVTGTYQTFQSTNLSTLLTLHKDKIQRAAALISESVRSIEPSTGLVTSAAAELNESAYDLLTELGELPETVNMIYDALKKIITYYLEVKNKVNVLKRSKRSNEPISLLDDIASLWMGYRYGIMPIVYSINDALDYLEMKGTLFRTVRQGQNHSVSLEIPGWTFPDLQVRERIWAKGRFQASSGNGLGMNPVTTAWELIPLSFIIDWVFNVGDLLSALSPSINFDEKEFTQSLQCKQTLMGKHGDIPFAVPFVVDLYDRRKINPLVHVGLNLDIVMTFKRKLDALALSWFTFVRITTPRR